MIRKLGTWMFNAKVWIFLCSWTHHKWASTSRLLFRFRFSITVIFFLIFFLISLIFGILIIFSIIFFLTHEWALWGISRTIDFWMLELRLSKCLWVVWVTWTLKNWFKFWEHFRILKNYKYYIKPNIYWFKLKFW